MEKKPHPIRRNRPKPLEIVPSQVPDIGEPRRSWQKWVQEEWERYRRSEVAAVLDEKTDWAALYRLFDLYDERERLRVAVIDQPLTEGHHGQPVMNPLRRVLMEVDQRIVHLEDRFGRNPKARIALGIAIADAHKSLEALNEQFREGS